MNAQNVADVLDVAGWTSRVDPDSGSDEPRTHPVDLVIGVDADVASFRAAAVNEVPVVTANGGDHSVIDHLVATGKEFSIRTSPLGTARIDCNPPTPIVQRATVTAVERCTELTWTSPITQHLPLERITSIAVDVPEPLHRGPGSRSNSTAMGAVMTFRSANGSSSVLLHPDDDYRITTPDGTDIVIHIDQRSRNRSRRIHLGAHPIGLRILDHPTGPPT